MYDEDDPTKTYLTTTKSRIAEETFVLRSKPFSLKFYPMYYTIYDLNVPNIVIMSGRQVGKSTTESCFQLAESIGIHDYPSLYTAPKIEQMRLYSTQRVADVLRGSPLVKRYFTNPQSRKNVTERSLANGSVMMFRAMSQLESIRGLTAYRWFLDEIQDYVSDDIPVVEEVMSSAPPGMKRMMYTGTAKTSQNILEMTWRKSTMAEWIIKCEECGSHNIPSVENIGPSGFSCKKCKGRCDVTNGYWLSLRGDFDTDIHGFHVPQIILPMHQHPEKWKDILKKHSEYSPIRFMNEVMGISAGSGVTWITYDHVRKCCMPEFEQFNNLYNPTESYLAVFGTTDWGATARKSFTINAIWGLTRNGRIKLLNVKRYHENDPLKQIADICRRANDFGVEFFFNDWGCGWGANDLLMRESKRPVFQNMYVGEQRALIDWDPNGRLWKTNRTSAMTETFVKIREEVFHFFQWKDSERHFGFNKFADDILGIYEEKMDDRFANDKIKFDHPEGSPDDFMHCCVYANLVVLLLRTGRLHQYMGQASMTF